MLVRYPELPTTKIEGVIQIIDLRRLRIRLGILRRFPTKTDALLSDAGFLVEFLALYSLVTP